jgi:hypothetical protein
MARLTELIQQQAVTLFFICFVKTCTCVLHDDGTDAWCIILCVLSCLSREPAPCLLARATASCFLVGSPFMSVISKRGHTRYHACMDGSHAHVADAFELCCCRKSAGLQCGRRVSHDRQWTAQLPGSRHKLQEQHPELHIRCKHRALMLNSHPLLLLSTPIFRILSHVATAEPLSTWYEMDPLLPQQWCCTLHDARADRADSVCS